MKATTKDRIIAGCLAFTLVLLTYSASTQESTRNTTILAGCELEYPPFCIVEDDGTVTGFSVELFEAACRRMEIEVSWHTGAWAQVKQALESKEIQALPLVGRTPEREALFDFTFPYLSLHGALVVRNDQKDINSIDDLTGKELAVMAGDNAEEYIRRENHEGKIVTYQTFENALIELSRGNHDAVVLQGLLATRLLKELKLDNLHVLETPLFDLRQDFCFAVSEGDSALLSLLNEGLALVIADGTFEKLRSKWFAGTSVPDSKRLIIGGDMDYPPYEYLDSSGEPVGYNVDLSRALARVLDLDIEIRLGPWAQIREGLDDGSIDIVQGMFYSEERDLIFDFSTPHTTIHHVAVTRIQDNISIQSIDDLQGKTIVVIKGDIMQDWVRSRMPSTTILTASSQEDALEILTEGNGNVALVARVPALHLIKKHNWNGLKVSSNPILTSEFCYAVSGNNHALIEQISDGLKLLNETGELQQIQKAWFDPGYEQAPALGKLFSSLALLLLPFFVVLLVALIWSYTLRRQVKERTAQLAESEARYRAVAEDSSVLICRFLPNGTITYVNPAFCRYYSYSNDEEVVEKNYFKLMESTEVSTLQEELENLSVTSPTSQHEHRVVMSDGTLRWHRCNSTAIFNSREQIIAFQTLCEDITNQKNADLALQESENKYRTLFECAGDFILILEIREEEQPVIIDLNKAACVMHGYSREELIGRSISVINPEIKKVQTKELREKLKDRETVVIQTTHLRSDGTFFPVEAALSLFDTDSKYPIIIAVERDITQRKQVEDDLKRSERLLRAAMDCSPAGIAIADAPDGKLRYVNRAGLGIRGKSWHEVVENVGIEEFVSSWEIRHLDGTFYQFEEVPLARALLFGETCDAKFIIHREDQEDRVVWGNAAPIHDEQGNVVSAVVVFPDITEQVRYETEVLEKNLFLGSLIESVPLPLFYKDNNGVYLGCNSAFEKFAGLRQEEIKGKMCEDIFPDSSDFTEANAMLQRNKDTQVFETHIADKTGNIAEVLIHKAQFTNNKGEVAGTIGTILDLTERNQTKRQIDRANRSLGAINACNNAVIHTTNENMMYKALCKILVEICDYKSVWVGAIEPESDSLYPVAYSGIVDGKSIDQAISKTKFKSDYDLAKFALQVKEPIIHDGNELNPREHNIHSELSSAFITLPILSKSVNYGICIVLTEKVEIFNQEEVSLLSELADTVAFGLDAFRDRKEREQALNRLAESESKLLEAQRIAHVGSWQWDLETGKVEWSDELFNIYGRSEIDGPLEPQFFLENAHPKDRDKLAKAIEQSIGSGKFECEYRFYRYSDNVVRWIHAKGEVIHGIDGKAVRHFGTAMDITDLRHAESAKTVSEQLYQTLFSSAQDAIVILDPISLETVNVNPAALKLFKATTIREFSKVTLWENSPKYQKDGQYSSDKVAQFMNVTLKKGSCRFQWLHQLSDNTRFEADTLINKIELGERILLQVTIRDISKEVAIEEQLRQAQKMEAIGTLAGGIAHDFNNILYSILGYSELAAQDIPRKSKAQAMLLEIQKASERAAALVSQILTISRKKERSTGPISLAAITKETVKMLRGTLPSTIEIQTHIDESCGNILGDSTEIHQIVLNLCTNAYHTMKDSGGKLEVHIDEISIESEEKANELNITAGTYCRLIVSDTGKGIAKDHLDRIFEPYFTTKPVGEGTGLGLATVDAIVRASKGVITVNSKLDEGTTFEVLLPLASDINISQAQELKEESPEGGDELILAVDDEPALSTLHKVVLEQLGYKVHNFSSAKEALQAYDDSNGAYKLVITDQTMPNMTGLELSSALLQRKPDLPIILCTGHSDVVDKDKAMGMGIRAYLKKPIHAKTMAKTVRQLLDEIFENVES